MNARQRSSLLSTFLVAALPLLVWLTRDLAGQTTGSTLTILSRDARRSMPLVSVGTQEMIALDDLAAIFGVTVREEGGAITVSYKGRTVVLTPDQTLASVAGRVISLPAPPTRVNGRWLVPIDVISRALAGIYDARIELRRTSHLVILGEMRVPRLIVRHEPWGGGARVTIESLPRAGATITRDQSDHLTVRFDAEALDVAFPPGQVAGFVQGYRPLDATAIAIDLGPRAGTFRNSLQVADATSTLVIDVSPQDAPASTVTQTEPAPADPVPPELPSLSAATGLRTIVVDAGHGGDERGVTGPGGTLEKDVALAMARRLKAVIESRLGARVLMTRDGDRLVTVSDRTALANNNKADLFISLHANGAWRPAATGATIYVATFPDGALDPQATLPERLPAFGGGFREIELVPWNLAQARHRDRSEALASLLADAFRERVPVSSAPIERAPLRLLESANMPAVLIEAGVLTNRAQEVLLEGAEFQGTLAQAIVDAIVRFRGGTVGEAP